MRWAATASQPAPLNVRTRRSEQPPGWRSNNWMNWRFAAARSNQPRRPGPLAVALDGRGRLRRAVHGPALSKPASVGTSKGRWAFGDSYLALGRVLLASTGRGRSLDTRGTLPIVR